MAQPETLIPGAMNTVVKSTLDDPVPEFGDSRRAAVISLISSALGIDMVDPSVRALLWLADLDALRALHSECIRSPTVFRLLLGQGGTAFRDALTAWASDVFNRWAEITEDPLNLCRARDRDCVITRYPDTKIANVYPHRPADAPDVRGRVALWDALGLFWAESRVAGWRQAAFGCGCTNEPGNTMLLREDVSHAWASLHFALRPVGLSQDGRSLKVQFYWLPSQQFPSVVPLLSPPAFGPDNTGCWDFTNPGTLERLQSGDYLLLMTRDPEGSPLPSFALLEIQWYLHRAATLSGLTNPPQNWLLCEPYEGTGST